jgi:hypothetical protein
MFVAIAGESYSLVVIRAALSESRRGCAERRVSSAVMPQLRFLHAGFSQDNSRRPEKI